MTSGCGCVTRIESGAGVETTWRGMEESCTCGVKLNCVPLAIDLLGVPLICPDVAFSINPSGSFPERMVQLKGGTPPEVWIGVEYKAFKTAEGKAPLDVMVKTGGALMMTVKRFEFTESGGFPLSVTFTTNE